MAIPHNPGDTTSNLLVSVPIFTKLNDKNGTLYNFSQFNNDVTKSIANPNTFKREPSKFACIKLPRWQNKTGQKLYLDPTKIDTSPLVTDPNILLPKLLQNYTENLKAYAVKAGILDINVDEWAFWKLMQTLGAVNLSQMPKSNNVVDLYGINTIVKYIGDINLVNYVEYGNRTYTELYVHIQSDAKPLTDIKWLFNANTANGNNLARLPRFTNGSNISLGLEESSTELTNAVYDFNDVGNTIQYYDMSLKSHKSALNFKSAISNENLVDFDFNAILLYYDTYELDANGNEQNRQTKLGSIFLINDFVQNVAGGYWEIPSTTKYNAGSNNTLTGNAIAYRLCTNFMSTGEQSTIDTIVNEYNTVSMDLYVTALQEMMKTADYFKTEQTLIQQIAAKLSVLNYGDDIYNKLQENSAKLETLTNTVNSVIGSTGYTVTNFQLLDAFAKLSNDFKGINGQYVENTFVFNGAVTSTTGGQSIAFNNPYAYVSNNKYSIGYSDEAMLQVGLIRNKLISKYSVSHLKNDSGQLMLTLNSNDDTLTYAIDGQIFNNALHNQVLQLSFASNSAVAKPYILVINKNNGKFEIYDYNVIKSSALDKFAYVGHFIMPTVDLYNSNGLHISIVSDNEVSIKSDIHVLLKDGNGQGSYKNGDTVLAGTDITDVVKHMLIDESLMSYEQPTALITIDNFYAFYNNTSLYKVRINFNQNDAGPLENRTLASNELFCKFEIDLVEHTVTIGELILDYLQMPTEYQNLFTFYINENTSELNLSSNLLEFATVNNPATIVNNCVIIPQSGVIELYYNVATATNYDDFEFFLPLEFSDTHQFIYIIDEAEHEAGIVKYDFDGNEVLGYITAGVLTTPITFIPKQPMLVVQVADLNDIVDVNFLPYKQVVSFDKDIALNCWLSTGKYIVIATHEDDTNTYNINSLYINDTFACNLKSITPTTSQISINHFVYNIKAYGLNSAFIEPTQIVTNISKTI
jgi:hypothetical protein